MTAQPAALSHARAQADPPSFDARAFRRALGRFPTGVTIVTTRAPDGGFVGLTANSFNSVSLDPPLVLWSLGKAQGSLPHFQNARVFAVNVLAADQIDLSNRFASPSVDRFRGVATHAKATGAPVLEGVSAWFDCRLRHSYDGGDHVIFVGEVLAFDTTPRPPLVYAGGEYGLSARHPLAPAPRPRGEADPPAPPPDAFVEDYLAYLLAKASSLVSAQFHETVRRAGLGVTDWRVLATLSDGLPRPVGALARTVLVPQPTLTRQLDRMAADGLIERRPDPEDRRRTAVFLTDAGRARVAPLLLAAKAHEGAVAQRHDSARVAALKATLRDLIAELEEQAERPVTEG